MALVLSAHLRPQLTERQLISVHRQTVRPRQTVVLVSPGLPVHEGALNGHAQIRTTFPFTAWWRFQIAASLSAKYVAILDDDTLPAPNWLRAAVSYLTANPNDCVVSAGLVLDKDNGEQRVGPGAVPKVPTRVDIGLNGWVLRTDLLQQALVNIGEPPSSVYGWGIMISYGLQPKGRCVVLPYDDQTAGMTEPPVRDPSCLSRSPSWSQDHHNVVRSFRSAEWKLLCEPDAPE